MSAPLREAGIDVPVIERTERLFVGAVRNLGIAATSAPYVGFLASDCTAARGWSHHRIRAHQNGQATVASAVVPSHPRSRIAWASHIALFRRRLPGVDRKDAAVYGASYERVLFATYGLFRADIRVGEDTEFHARLPKEHQPVWTPQVQAIHDSPTGLVQLIRDQYTRGVRASDAAWNVSGRRIAFSPRWTYMQVRSAIRLSRHAVKRRELPTVRVAWLLLPLAIGAYAMGGAAANRRRDRGAED